MRSQVLMLLISLLFLSINGDSTPVGCKDVQIEGMKGLSSELAQFQLNLDSEFVTPTDDQNSFVFDDSTNQFYKLTYGPVNIEIQSKPATQNMIRLKVIIAKAPDDEVRNVFKGNFLIKNFDVSSPVQFENAFCVVTGSFVDCTCCEDHQRANAENTTECRSYESSNQIDIHTSTYIAGFGSIYGEGTAWTSDKNNEIFFKYYEFAFLSDARPFMHISFYDSNNVAFKAYDCAVNDLLMAGCRAALTADTKKVSLKGAKGSQEAGNAIVVLEIENYKIKQFDHCMDNSSPAELQYMCLCPHGQPMSSECQTIVLMPQIYTPTHQAAAFYFKGSIPSSIPDQYQYTSGSYNGIVYKLMFKTTTGYSTYPKSDGGLLDVVIKYSEAQEHVTGTITANFDLVKNVITFQPTFCTRKSNDQMVCVCCTAGSKDPFCATVPAVDMHFQGTAGSFGHVRGMARAWVSELKDTPKMNFYLSLMAPSFPDTSSVSYIITGDAAPSVDKPGHCQVNNLCSFDIHTNSQKGIFKMHDNVIMEIPIANNLIDLNTNDPVCHDVQSSSDDWKACMCPIGVEMSSSTCHLPLPKSCSHALPLTDQTALTIRFTDPEFNGIPINGKVQRKYLTDISTGTPRYFTLTYEQIQGFATKRPSSPSAFLMNITVGDLQTTSQPSGTITGVVGFEVNSNDWFIFENAFCAVDHGTVECSCCELNTVDGLCATMNSLSQADYIFSTIVDNVGLITGSGVIRLDVQKNLMLEGHTLDAMFNAPFVIALSTSKSGTTKKLTECNDWATCQVQMTDDDLSADDILLQLKFQGLTTLSTLTTIKLDNGKIKVSESQCLASDNSDELSRGCVCKSGQPKDSNCPSINTIDCENGKVNGKLIDGVVSSFPAVSIQTTLEFKEPTDNVEVMIENLQDANNASYSLLYSKLKDISDNQFTMKLKIGPLKSSSASENGQIELNFDLNNEGVVFSEAYCLRKSAYKFDCFCSSKDLPSNSVSSTTPSTVEEKNPCAEATKSSDFCDIDPKDDMNTTNLDQYANQTNEKLDEKIESGTMTADDLQVVSELLVKMADIKDASTEQRKSVLSVVNSALNVQSTTFEESSQETKNRFLKSINTIAESSIDDLEYLDGTQFGLHKTSVGCEEKNDGWTGIVDDGEKFKKAEKTDNQVASIELDKSKLCNKATGQSRAVYFVIFRNSRLFTQSNEKRTQSFAVTGHETTSTFDRCKMNFHETNGLVLSSVILDGNQTGNVNARMKFKKDQNASSLPSHSNLAVTWWDQTEWSTERQCKMHEENGEFVAHCDHLTNFALLIVSCNLEASH
ncbi:hypothetical protein M3Y95_00395800 [Aphelenchoides besseyi]|nr:hypothetical protein M3Y95_00395800 [Aphelenchoides besseyi]